MLLLSSLTTTTDTPKKHENLRHVLHPITHQKLYHQDRLIHQVLNINHIILIHTITGAKTTNQKVLINRFSLVEDKHCFISLQNDENGILKCNIKCYCRKSTILVFRRGKFQLPNLYRHLKSLTNECPALRQILKILQYHQHPKQIIVNH